jgi:phage baseplate assembly protein gpV
MTSDYDRDYECLMCGKTYTVKHDTAEIDKVCHACLIDMSRQVLIYDQWLPFPALALGLNRDWKMPGEGEGYKYKDTV